MNSNQHSRWRLHICRSRVFEKIKAKFENKSATNGSFPNNISSFAAHSKNPADNIEMPIFWAFILAKAINYPARYGSFSFQATPYDRPPKTNLELSNVQKALPAGSRPAAEMAQNMSQKCSRNWWRPLICLCFFLGKRFFLLFLKHIDPPPPTKHHPQSASSCLP